MFTRAHRVAAALVAIFIAARSSPSTADVTTLDEATFLKRVAETPRAVAFGERVRAARAAVGAAAVWPNPTLSYEREAIPSIDASDTFVRLAVPLDISGRRGLARSAASATADAEQATTRQLEAHLHFDARIAFLDAIYAREHLARLDDARTVLVAIVDSLKTQSTQGDASSYDLDRTALELELLDDERADARRELAIARLRLGALIGQPSTPVDASGTIALAQRPTTEPLAPRRGDVDAAYARERQAKNELSSAGRSWVPRIELLAGVLSSTGADELGYIVGISGELAIFDRGGAQAAKARAEAKRWRAEGGALASEATAEAEQARVALTMRIEQTEAYAAGPAKRALDLQKRATVAYREGDRSILELLDVQRNARQAMVQLLKLTHEARRAELGLARAMGKTP